MEILTQNIEIVMFLIALITTLLLMQGLKIFSTKKEAFRIDSTNRKVPKFIGGIVPIAFILNYGVAILLYKQGGASFSIDTYIFMAVACTYFFVIGYMFDNNQIVAKKKIVYELIGIIFLSVFGPKIDFFRNPFNNTHINVIAYMSIPLTIVWYFVVINAVNVCRSIDRLTAGIVTIVSMAIFMIGVVNGNVELTVVAAILSAISLVLTLFNINVNNITGLTFGVILTIMSTSHLIKSVLTLMLAILLLGVPIFNLLYVVYKRLKRGTILTIRDDGHLFYKLQTGGFTNRGVLGIMYIVTFAVALSAYAVYKNQNVYYALIGIAVLVIVGIFVERRPVHTGKYTVMSIFGTRPEAIKMAPIIKLLDKIQEINNVVCVTGQHKEMLYQVLDIFDIKPQYDLDIMRNKQSLVGISSRILRVLEKVVKREKPDLILVHGDTTSTFIGALLGFYMQVKVGHVEAGLRTYNRKEPFPEEINRVLTGALADMHFSPSIGAKENLLKEGVAEDMIYLTGNTAVDSTKYTYKENYTFRENVLNSIDCENQKVILMTAHRRENIGEPLKAICRAVKKIVANNKDVVVVYAVHKNPAVREIVYSILKGLDRVYLIEPLDVSDMHNLMKRSYLMLTDSGGLQEEAPSFNLPTIVLRNVTERPEGLETGILKLAGTDEKVIYDMATKILKDKSEHDRMAYTVNPYGDGYAAERIVQAICHRFGLTEDRPNDFDFESQEITIHDGNGNLIDIEETNILGVKIHKVNMEQAISKIFDFFKEDRVHIVHTTNPEFILTAQKDEYYKMILNSADLAVPDGIGAVIASKFTDTKLDERVSGCDLAMNLMDRMQGTEYSVYILGSSEPRLEKAIENLKAKYPKLKIVGHHHGYFNDSEDGRLIFDINRSGASLLLVGLGGIPKQETWVWQNKDKLKVKVTIGIGGSIDVMSGEVKRAPKIYQKLCLEWLYRTLSEPKKRIPRVYRLPYFVFLSGIDSLKKKGK